MHRNLKSKGYLKKVIYLVINYSVNT